MLRISQEVVEHILPRGSLIPPGRLCPPRGSLIPPGRLFPPRGSLIPPGRLCLPRTLVRKIGRHNALTTSATQRRATRTTLRRILPRLQALDLLTDGLLFVACDAERLQILHCIPPSLVERHLVVALKGFVQDLVTGFALPLRPRPDHALDVRRESTTAHFRCDIPLAKKKH